MTVIIKDQKLDMVHKTIRHGFFGKQGGVSEGLYESLNCGTGSDDNPEHVQQNRHIVATSMGLELDHLVAVWQVHSADCIIVDAPMTHGADKPKADGMVTDKAGIALGTLTADCTPILFAGLKEDGAPVIGACHSGWGGSLKGIGEATVDKMIELGTQMGTIQASIGPCIGPKSYEVSIGFEKPFLERNPEDEHFFREARKEGHLMFDMPGYVASRLAAHGVRHVTITGNDTFAEEDSFFSYRRKTHNNEPDYGRQIATIVIKT